MRYLLIFLTLNGIVSVMIPTFAYGLCVSGTDWDEVPCWGRMCGDSKEPACIDPNWWKERWAPYYDYKGKEWMDAKKQELMHAIESNTVIEWKSLTPNGTNSNVHDYYFYMGEVPSIYGVYVEQFFADSFPPLKQIKAGAKLDEIFCKSDFVLIQKYNGSPACIKPTSLLRLVENGWGYISRTFETETDLLNTTITGGKILVFRFDVQAASIVINLETTSDGSLELTIPKALTDSMSWYKNNPSHGVLIDGQFFELDETITIGGTTVIIPFKEGATIIEIFGSHEHNVTNHSGPEDLQTEITGDDAWAICGAVRIPCPSNPVFKGGKLDEFTRSVSISTPDDLYEILLNKTHVCVTSTETKITECSVR